MPNGNVNFFRVLEIGAQSSTRNYPTRLRKIYSENKSPQASLALFSPTADLLTEMAAIVCFFYKFSFLPIVLIWCFFSLLLSLCEPPEVQRSECSKPWVLKNLRVYIYLRSGLLFLNAAHTVHTPISIIILVIYFCIYDWKYTQLLNTSCRRIFVACHRDWQLNSRVHCSQGHAQYEKFLFFPQELIANVPLLGYFIVFVASLHYCTRASLSTNEWPLIRLFLELSVLTFYIQLRTGIEEGFI